MKKKFLALTFALALACGTGMTAAAESATAGTVVSVENRTGQVLTYEAVVEFASTTTISTSVVGAKLEPVAPEVAQTVIAKANEVVGEHTFIASIVDLQVPEGTGRAEFTLGCPNVWKGQKVTVLHMKADGTFENIKPSSVENGSVTFTLSSYSPVAVVVDASAPRTAGAGDAVVIATALTGIAGLLAAGKKARALKED